jgi:hypothetical protein
MIFVVAAKRRKKTSSPRTRGPMRRVFSWGTREDGFCTNKRRWLMGWTAPYGIDVPE